MHRPIIVHHATDEAAHSPSLPPLLVGLAKRHPVLLVADPRFIPDTQPHLQIDIGEANLVQATPVLPTSHPREMNAQCASMARMLRAAFVHHPGLQGRFNQAIQWFRSPLTAPGWLDQLGGAGAIYDCAQRAAAPRDEAWQASEHWLLKQARLILADSDQLSSLPADVRHKTRCLTDQTLRRPTPFLRVSRPDSPPTVADSAQPHTWPSDSAQLSAQLFEAFRSTSKTSLPPGFVAASALAWAAEG